MIGKKIAKKISTDFYYWWHNQPGTNTQDGFDSFWEQYTVTDMNESVEEKPKDAFETVVYSDNEEVFNYSTVEEALESAWNSAIDETEFTVFIGETTPKKASDFCPSSVSESLSEIAYEEMGEFVEGWPRATEDVDRELQAFIEKAVDYWADKHGLQPDFYGVKNVKELSFKLIKESEHFDMDNFELVSSEAESPAISN